MKTTTTTTFADILRNYETAVINNNNGNGNNADYEKALSTLAQVCALSVLKKLYNVGGATMQTIGNLKKSLVTDLRLIDRLHYANNNATELSFSADGDIVVKVIDEDMNKAVTKLASQNFSGEGLDLYNTAIIAILEQTNKVNTESIGFMEIPYNIRRLKKKVYIKDIDSLGGYETVTTTPIQEIYKAIRREIENNRSIQVANHKYTYIADMVTDNNSTATDTVYRRLPKYSGLAYGTTDLRGRPSATMTADLCGRPSTTITADNESVEKVDRLIDLLQLSNQQATVLQYRLCGYGYKAIATALGVKPSNIQTQVKRIQEKATAFGFVPTTLL